MMAPFPWHVLTLPYFYSLLLFLFILFGILWMIHVRLRNASLADVGFCVGLGCVVGVCSVAGEGHLLRRILVGGMGGAYAVRLGWHLLRHRVWGKVEDSRYRKIRKRLGPWKTVGFLGYFLAQVPACFFFAALFCWVMAQPQAVLRGWDLLGIGIFLLALGGGTLADRQLEQFRSNPDNRGKVCTAGLWQYSRHPNYFFEILHWCAYIPLAIGLPLGWLALVWPLIMMASLLWVTGVPLVEAQALESRGDNYRRYQRTTNRLFPWVPKRNE